MRPQVEINRAMSTENTRSLLLSLMMMTALSLAPMLAHAAVFWDDEMEEGNTDFSPAYMLSTLIPSGTMAYDTSIKFSGNGSIRLNYPAACQTLTTQGQCGGSLTRTFPLTDDIWRRVYFRMSGIGPNPTNSGVFEVASAFTKVLKGESTTVGGLYSRHWWVMGCCGSKRFSHALENVPSPGQATTAPSSITLADNRWYCVETHEVMNSPGVANGITEVWVDGVKVLTKTDVMWRQAESTVQWKEFSIFRQIGIGNLWFDRFAAGTTRIGCLGGTSASDTTRPAQPQGLVIK